MYESEGGGEKVGWGSMREGREERVWGREGREEGVRGREEGRKVGGGGRECMRGSYCIIFKYVSSLGPSCND